MKVEIDGVVYVPATYSAPTMEHIARGILAQFWGHVGSSEEELREKMKGITVRVFDDGQGEPIEKVLADIAREIR